MMDGGPAFPTAADNGHSKNQDGMTLRDYFAAKAMQAIISNNDYLDAIETELKANPFELIAGHSYFFADKMLEERKRK